MSVATEVTRALAVVDVGAVERNCRRLRDRLDGGALCAVVKADGYGHGAVECARAAIAGGAEWLAVAAAAEAADLRSALPDVRILTMGALTAGELDVALGADSDVAVWRPAFLREVAARSAALGVSARVHVKYDTGMGRLGERDPVKVRALLVEAEAAEDVELVGLWTHFATADDPGSTHFDAQLSRFRDLAEAARAAHPDILCHAANSAATVREPGSHFDLVRCGIAIYGLDPFHEDPGARELEPALELRSYVADVKRFERGDSAGYGQTWRAPQETDVGVLPIGYGDGFRRGLSSNADVLVGGRRFPVVGTVSMDNITVDLGPQGGVEPGAPAVLIGAQEGQRILCEELARRLGTINYEITCGISARVPRMHVSS
jgi:alanine racemase